MKTKIVLVDLQGDKGGNKEIVLEGELVVTYCTVYDVDSDGERNALLTFDSDSIGVGPWVEEDTGVHWTDWNVEIQP